MNVFIDKPFQGAARLAFGHNQDVVGNNLFNATNTSIKQQYTRITVPTAETSTYPNTKTYTEPIKSSGDVQDPIKDDELSAQTDEKLFALAKITHNGQRRSHKYDAKVMKLINFN